MKKGTLFLYLAALFTCIILFGWPILVIVAPASVAIYIAYAILQAVIFHDDYMLYYDDHYNNNRYRTDKKTNYAQIALEALLIKQPATFDAFATKAYGCQLPKCNK